MKTAPSATPASVVRAGEPPSRPTAPMSETAMITDERAAERVPAVVAGRVDAEEAHGDGDREARSPE